MNSTSAFVLTIVVLALFGGAGIVAGVSWRRRTYLLSRPFSAIGVIFATLGVWLVIAQQDQLAEWGTVMNWPSVQGVVGSSSVAGERAFHPEIVYEYEVAGTTFRDSTSFDTPSFGGRNAKRDVAETISAQYPVGSPVTVHYDPNQPSRSLLRISPEWSLFGKAGFGGTLFGIGLFLIIASLYRRT